jgi:hypothetical protein
MASAWIALGSAGALGASLLIAYDLIRTLMTDLTGLRGQVDQTLSTMAEAVQEMRNQVIALGARADDGDDQAIADLAARLKFGTDALAAAIEQARASRQ